VFDATSKAGHLVGIGAGRCQPHMDSHFKDKLFFT
jgi:hypothetical protein